MSLPLGRLPPLYCPLTCTVRADTAELSRAAVDWAARVCGVDAAERHRLERIDIGLLTGMVMPDGLPVATQLAADFSAWLFTFDDQYADEARLPLEDLAALVCGLTRVLEAPEVETTTGTPAITAGLRDLSARLAAVATPAQVARWVEAMRGYLTAVLWECTNRARSVMLDLERYTVMRLHSGAMKPSVLLLDVADGYELPTPEISRPDVRALIEMTCLLGGWDNDMISYEKESGQVGGGQNLVDVIVRQDGCSPRSALSRAIAMRDRVMSRFMRQYEATLRDASPRLARYVTSLGYWIRANIEWGRQSARYHTAGVPTPGPLEWADAPVDARNEPLPVPTISWWWR